MFEWFKVSLLILYFLLIVFLVSGVVLSFKVRSFLFKIHKSPSDDYSWLRYACTFILIVTLGIAVYQTTYSEINVSLITILIGIAITGKVTASSVNDKK